MCAFVKGMTRMQILLHLLFTELSLFCSSCIVISLVIPLVVSPQVMALLAAASRAGAFCTQLAKARDVFPHTDRVRSALGSPLPHTPAYTFPPHPYSHGCALARLLFEAPLSSTL